MRAIRIAGKTIAPLAVVAALMALPSMSAASMYWGEYDYQPLGGTPTSEDPVTADFSGTITLDNYPGNVANLTCDVAGEIRIANDWDNPGTAATNEIVSIAPAQSVAQSCTGYWGHGSCHVTDVTFSGLGWDGLTTDLYTSGFNGLSITTKYKSTGCASAPDLVVEGDITTALPLIDVIPGNEESVCLIGWEIGHEQLVDELPAFISGTLALDVDSIEGLSTNDGGPCVTLNEQ